MMLIRSGYKAGYIDFGLHSNLHLYFGYIAAVQEGLTGVIQYQVRELFIVYIN